MSMFVLSGQTPRLAAASMHIDGMIAIAMLILGLLLILKSRPLGQRMLR